MAKPPCPLDLGEAGRALWADVVADWELSAADTALLTQACYLTDHLVELNKVARAGDILIVGRLNQILPNPALAELRSERRLLVTLLTALGFTSDSDDGGPRMSREQRVTP